MLISLMSIRKLYFVLMLLASSFVCPVFAGEFAQGYQFWSALKASGLFVNDHYNYVFELHGRFRFENPVFAKGISRFGLGYVVNPSIRVFLGYDFDGRETPLNDDKVMLGQRVWQQVSAQLSKDEHFSWASRTRFEQRFSFDFSGTALRLRELLSWNFTDTIYDKITPSIYDEVFLNLNHPSWVSRKTVSQNRVFVGLLIPWKKYAMVRVGYMNQTFFGVRGVEMNHIFHVALIINHDLI